VSLTSSRTICIYHAQSYIRILDLFAGTCRRRASRRRRGTTPVQDRRRCAARVCDDSHRSRWARRCFRFGALSCRIL